MISYDRVRALLHYDPGTGVFTCVKKYASKVRVGDVVGGAGGFKYARVSVEGRSYLVSRLAWFYMTGAWPKHEIDHKNLNKLDNSWKNLREATRGENNRNKRAKTATPKGVRRRFNRWGARITVDHREVCLGSFSTSEEASAAYVAAAEKLHGEFARLT